MTEHGDPHRLDQLQRWFQAVISHPDGVEAGVSTPDAQAEISLAPHQLESVVLPSQRVSGAGRLAVYANAYFARLAECLEEEYPTLSKTLGEETFAAFVVGYLQAHPSRSYTLSQLGAGFPDFLAATRPDGQEGEPETDWVAFLIDLCVWNESTAKFSTAPATKAGGRFSSTNWRPCRPSNSLMPF